MKKEFKFDFIVMVSVWIHNYNVYYDYNGDCLLVQTTSYFYHVIFLKWTTGMNISCRIYYAVDFFGIKRKENG